MWFWIQDPEENLFRIPDRVPGLKRLRIPDPDPQHCKKVPDPGSGTLTEHVFQHNGKINKRIMHTVRDHFHHSPPSRPSFFSVQQNIYQK
jgi:hypothetical protein